MRLREKLLSINPAADLAWNPEFLREGFAVEDTLHPSRLVVGVMSDSAENILKEVYAANLAEGTPWVRSDLPTAELVKVAANSFLATKISFINAMAEICDASGADVTVLAQAIGYDPRIGNKFLQAGIGFGGGCLPKDIRAFMARAGELGATESLEFLREIDSINNRSRNKVVEMAKRELGGSCEGKRVAVLGAAFKPNSDDIRDSPALYIASQLKVAGADVVVHDPKAIENSKKKYPELSYVDSVDQLLAGADLVLHLTEWKQYREIDPVHAKSLAHGAIIIDGRNALDMNAWSSAGWRIHAVGRTSR
jgi:UDPglucose 6-dehydrogenase